MPNEMSSVARMHEEPRALRSLLRKLPHNLDAEMALLGAIILNNRAYERVADFLRPQHFALLEHARIFDAISRLIDSGKLVDPVTLKDFFERDDGVSPGGGQEYLFRLVECAATPINSGEYGRLVYDLFLRRELIALGEDIVNTAYESEVEETADKQIERAESSLYEMAEDKSYGGFVPAAELVDNVFAASSEALRRRIEGVQNGIKTGLLDLDKILGGLRGGQLIIIAGRPSMGKTTVATNITFNVARDYAYRRASEQGGKIDVLSGGRTVFVSFETDRETLINQNFQVLITGIPGQSLLDPDPRELSAEVILAAGKRARQDLSRMPIAIMDRIATVAGIRTAVRRWKRQHGVDLLVVDYLGLIEQSNKKHSLYEHITETSRTLKALAKELNIPIIALCQLSRKVEERENKRPQLSDIRESGHLEQDADRIIFVYRDHYYLTKNQPPDDAEQSEFQAWQRKCDESANRMELIVAKNRFGPTGTAIVHYDATTAFVANAARDR